MSDGSTQDIGQPRAATPEEEALMAGAEEAEAYFRSREEASIAAIEEAEADDFRSRES